VFAQTKDDFVEFHGASMKVFRAKVFDFGELYKFPNLLISGQNVSQPHNPQVIQIPSEKPPNPKTPSNLAKFLKLHSVPHFLCKITCQTTFFTTFCTILHHQLPKSRFHFINMNILHRKLSTIFRNLHKILELLSVLTVHLVNFAYVDST
jgi:hypothetical protein